MGMSSHLFGILPYDKYEFFGGNVYMYIHYLSVFNKVKFSVSACFYRLRR